MEAGASLPFGEKCCVMRKENGAMRMQQEGGKSGFRGSREAPLA